MYLLLIPSDDNTGLENLKIPNQNRLIYNQDTLNCESAQDNNFCNLQV